MGRDCGYLAMASAIAAGRRRGALSARRARREEEIVQSVCEVIRRGFARGKRRVLIIKAEGVAVPTTKLVRLAEERLSSELNGAEIRATVLGHVVRGGNASYQDRLVAGRLGLAAVEALLTGGSDEMVAWQPPVKGGVVTQDSSVSRFGLDVVLRETAALIDGSSPVTRRRLQLMEHAAGVLPL